MSNTPRFTNPIIEFPFTTSTTSYMTDVPLTNHTINYMNIIAPLTSPRTTTPIKISTLTGEHGEIERLSTRCKGLETENEGLRVAQRSYIQEIDFLKDSLAHARDSDNKYNIICQEKDRLNSILAERIREIDLLRVRVAGLEGNGGQANNDLKQKLSLLASDNQRLNSLVFDKQKEIEDLKYKIRGLEDKYTLSFQEKDRILAERLREIDLLRIRITQSEGNNELKGKLTLLVSENERLDRILTEKTKEIDILKLRPVYNNEFEGKYHLALQERDRLNSILSERLREIDVLRMRIKEIERNSYQSDELRGKVALLASENDRLNRSLNEKVTIIREWESKYSSLEALYKKVKLSVDSIEEVKRNLVQSIEHTERREPSLRNSRSGEVAKKTARYYISSDTNTNAGSPPLKTRSPVMKSGFNSSLNSTFYV